MLTAPSVSRFFSSLQAYFNHMGERERKEKIIALSRVKLVDCDDTFSFFFSSFLFQDNGSCLSSTRLVETEEERREETNDKRARSGRNDASIILSFFRIVNCNSPNDRMEYNGNTPDAFSHKKFLNVSRLITRETFRSRNEILCRVISVRCFNARKRKKRHRIP